MKFSGINTQSITPLGMND